MAVTVKIPTSLRKFTADKAELSIEAPTVGAVLQSVEAAHPGLLAKLTDDEGKIRRFINIYLGDEDIRFLDGLETAVKSGDEISIIPAVAGGL
jgi:molybdopterin synthase sulfur carrier subunit